MARKEEEKKEIVNEEEEMLDDEIIELIDESGKSVQFYHIATIDYKEDWYVFFTPVEEVEGVSEDEVVIFKLGTDEEGNDVFLPIEDEKLLQEVYDEYVKMMEEEDDGGEAEDCGCGCDKKAKAEKSDCGCGCGENGCDLKSKDKN